MHEMYHWKQFNSGQAEPGKDEISRQTREVEAYDFQFMIIDSLKLKGYDELLSTEQKRVREIINQPSYRIEPNFANNNLVDIFGPFKNEKNFKEAAGMLMMRAIFKEYDQLPEKEAFTKKLNFIKLMGYR